MLALIIMRLEKEDAMMVRARRSTPKLSWLSSMGVDEGAADTSDIGYRIII